MGGAFLATLAYYITSSLDTTTSFQTFSRPMVISAVTGLFLGDFSTGVIMGGLLELIFMGFSNIGGSIPAQPASSAVFCVSMVIMGGIDMDASLAMAVPFGTVMNSLNQMWRPVYVLAEPLFEKWAREGNHRAYTFTHMIWSWTVPRAMFCVVTYIAIAVGASNAEAVISWIPANVMNGINAAGGLLPVVGFGILTHMLWTQGKHFLWILLGFLLSTYAGIPTLGVAGFAAIVAIVTLMRDVEIHNLRGTGVASQGETDELEDFLNG